MSALFVGVNSVLKGFHATQAVLEVGKEYILTKMNSVHDENAFFVLSKDGTIQASMPRELARLIAPFKVRGQVLCIVCSPTAGLRESNKGLFEVGGGIVMPCIYCIQCKSENVARTLAGIIPNSHLRKLKEQNDTIKDQEINVGSRSSCSAQDSEDCKDNENHDDSEESDSYRYQEQDDPGQETFYAEYQQAQEPIDFDEEDNYDYDLVPSSVSPPGITDDWDVYFQGLPQLNQR
ncbi:uncharacterized protein LOC116290010, partial [Actinia tenebrosa]|uniref:Uncharacterized protein LOC116290010 n=1 Tax=Actinia tenebrosa TaxID=6105 RepID=A0A6P8HJH8_ACTTE